MIYTRNIDRDIKGYYFTSFMETLKSYDINIDCEVITESISISQIWSNIKKVVIDLWKKISTTITKFFSDLKFAIQNKTLYYKRNKNKIISGFNNLSKESLPGYIYDHEKILEYSNKLKNADFVRINIDDDNLNYQNTRSKAGLAATSDSHKYNVLLNRIHLVITGEHNSSNPGATQDDIKESIRKTIYNNTVKESDNILSVYKSADEFYKHLTTNYSDKLKDITKSKDNIEYIVNEMLKKINEEEREAKNSDIYDNNLKEELRLTSVYYNFCLNIAKDISTSLCKFISDDFNQAKKIVDRCIESDKNQYIPNRFLEKAVQDQDVDTVKLALRQLISADPCFETTRIYNAIKYVESHGIKLYEDTFRQDLEIITDCSKWDDDYFAEAMVNLQFNFRKERLEHVKEVGKYLYSKKKNK